MNRFAYVGLHVTGLCFGVVLISGILIGVTFFNWPIFTLLLCIAGIVVIPDSIAGLRKYLGLVHLRTGHQIQSRTSEGQSLKPPAPANRKDRQHAPCVSHRVFRRSNLSRAGIDRNQDT